jgi:hypothetical protein
MMRSRWIQSRALARSAAALAVILLAPGFATRVRAAEEEPRPSLAGHTFVSTDLVPDAFVRTYVRTSLGIAVGQSIDYPQTVVGRDTLQMLNGALNYATIGIEYQSALRDWIAARLEGGLVSRLGTQGSSLVQEGVTITSGYDFGFLAKLHQTPKTMLSGTVDVTNQWVTVVDVRQFAEDVANGVPNARLFDLVPTVRTNAGLRFAWAMSHSFGATFLGEGSYGDAPRRQELTSWGWGLGASVDYDAPNGIPVGAALAYRVTSLPGVAAADNGNTSQTVLRVAYTGSKKDLIALDILGLFDRHNTRAESIWAGGLAFSTRIYF